MADTVPKPKLQLRSGASFNDKALSPSPKLMINHGKPNFTIQRTPKVQQNGGADPLSLVPQNGLDCNSSTNVSSISISSINDGTNNNDSSFKNANGNSGSSTSMNSNGSVNDSSADFIVKSTKFNGVYKPTQLPLSENLNAIDNEAAKVVLRRVEVTKPPASRDCQDEDSSVPEFILKQRRIQERLAKDNILDFENRRSGYFTHVMISPTSPNRTSFVETMSSPAIVPALEMPPPVIKEEPLLKKPEAMEEKVKVEVEVEVEGNDDVEEGEEEEVENEVKEDHLIREPAIVVVNRAGSGHFEPHIFENLLAEQDEQEEEEVAKAIEEVNRAVAGEDYDKPLDEEFGAELMATATKTVEEAVTNATKAVEATISAVTEPRAEQADAIHATVTHIEEAHKNGHGDTNGIYEVTISHTNGMAEPSIPAPDPSGNLGVNYEPKTVVSFSKDLGSEPNKYPDTVKVLREAQSADTAVESELQQLAKMKFDINADELDVQLTPVLRAE